MHLDQVVPWGRNFDEYRRMFALTPQDLSCRMLGCGDGPASFNAELSRQGGRVVSCDPIYQFSAEQIRARVGASYKTILVQVEQHLDDYLWDGIPSVEALRCLRMAAMNDFLLDYPAGRHQGRYVAAGLPCLPFVTASFDLALCSHLLFLYTEQLSGEMHVQSVLELCRVAREVRIFPLIDLRGQPSSHIEPVSQSLRQAGWQVSIETVPYEFRRGANQMMRICRGSGI